MSGSSDRIGSARLAPVGGRDTARLTQRVAIGVLALALGWFGYAALRPLPEIPTPVASTPGPIAEVAAATDRIEARERLLGAIESRGNLFSEDGLAWPVVVATEDDDPEIEIVTPDLVDDAMESVADAGSPGALALSESPPSAILRELQALTLRGIYGVNGELTALIYDGSIQDTSQATGAYRVGDKVGKAPWDLLAIDPTENRVIVRRAGQTLEVRMYEPLATRPAPSPASASATEAPKAPNASGVVTASAEEIAVDLQRAGVDLAEIRALLDLAENVEMPADEPAPVVIVTEPPVRGAPAGTNSIAPTRAMPAEMVDLLRMMAGDAAKQKATGNETAGGEQKPPTPDPDESDG